MIGNGVGKMKIDIVISADDIVESRVRNKIAVIIDIFRATSVL